MFIRFKLNYLIKVKYRIILITNYKLIIYEFDLKNKNQLHSTFSLASHHLFFQIQNNSSKHDSYITVSV